MESPRVCSLNNCNKKHEALGYCSIHYALLKRNGRPEYQRDFKIMNKDKKCILCNELRYRTFYCRKHADIVYNHRKREKLYHLLNRFTCMKCGSYDKRVLHFDHINGGGYNQRKLLGWKGSMTFYIKNPTIANQELQVLCANCNWIKRFIDNE